MDAEYGADDWIDVVDVWTEHEASFVRSIRPHWKGCYGLWSVTFGFWILDFRFWIGVKDSIDLVRVREQQSTKGATVI
jgi:hypothetical protein